MIELVHQSFMSNVNKDSGVYRLGRELGQHVAFLANSQGLPEEIAISIIVRDIIDTQIENKITRKQIISVLVNQMCAERIKHLRESGAGQKAIDRMRKRNQQELAEYVVKYGLAGCWEIIKPRQMGRK